MVTKRDDTLKIIKKTDSCRNFINRSSCNTTIISTGINIDIKCGDQKVLQTYLYQRRAIEVLAVLT